MKLFSMFKHKDKEAPKEEFSSFVIKTDNVSKSLSEVSKQYNIPLSNLDFDILAVESYVKLTKDTDFVIADEQTINLIKQKKLLADRDFEIKQSYEIKIRKYRFVNDFELIGRMEMDIDKTEVSYIVSSASILNYSSRLEFELIEELRKKKLKSGFLIDLDFLEEQFVDDIKNLVAKIKVVGLDKDYKIVLCKGLKPIKPIKMEIIEHYKKTQQTTNIIKEFIYPIKKNDIIVEIIKPKQGKNGRDCRGKLIVVPKYKDDQLPTFHITDDVTKREKDRSVFYISNKNGYVYIKDGAIFIKDELEVNQISLKTGNVKGAQDSNVKLEVKEKGVLKEAIKDGMVVETTELIVKGNVGNGAKIKAKKLQIDAQTHKGSKIVADMAQINAHKGYLKAKNAIIDRLEGGVVEAENVLINQGISGKVIAKEIKVRTLASHLTLIASQLIEIDFLKGSENRLIIDEGITNNKEAYIEELEEKYKDYEVKLRKYKQKLQENKDVITHNQPFIEKLKDKIRYNKKNNIVTNPIFIQKIRKFNDFVEKTKQIEATTKNIVATLKNIKKELNKLQQGVFLAKVVSHSGFKEYNRIEFHLIEPPIKITYDTKNTDENKNIFILKDFGEMDYKIVGERE